MADYILLRRLSSTHVQDLQRLYQATWWASDRSCADIAHMLSHSDITLGLANSQGSLVGFCRVLTDYVYRAVVYDVVVAESCRGQRLGRRLLDELLRLPELQSVETVSLFCLPELVPFYQKWGFEGSEKIRLMNRGSGLIPPS